MSYKHFSIEQFVTDEFFQRWVLKPDRQTNEFWENWMNNNPDRAVDIKKSIQLIKSIKYPHYPIKEEELDEIWQHVRLKVTDSSYLNQELHRKIRKDQRLQWLKIAATFSLIVVATFVVIIQLYQKPRVEISTRYGETKNIILPDNSEVILNANSSVAYQKDFEGEIRKVWLTGEAFFNVKQKLHNQEKLKFQVITGGVKIEVVGTSFNVKNRRSNTQVVLKSGKVEVEVDNPQIEKISMNPGELVDYSSSNRSIVKRVVEPDDYSAWTLEKIVFKETTLTDILTTLEDQFGYNVTLEHNELEDKRFTGSYLMDEPEILIKALEKTLGIEFLKTEKGYRVKSR